MNAEYIKITLAKSLIGRPGSHRRTVKALGLNRMHASIVKPSTPAIWGMVKKVEYLLRVEGYQGEESGYDEHE